MWNIYESNRSLADRMNYSIEMAGIFVAMGPVSENEHILNTRFYIVKGHFVKFALKLFCFNFYV